MNNRTARPLFRIAMSRSTAGDSDHAVVKDRGSNHYSTVYKMKRSQVRESGVHSDSFVAVHPARPRPRAHPMLSGRAAANQDQEGVDGPGLNGNGNVCCSGMVPGSGVRGSSQSQRPLVPPCTRGTRA